MTVPNFTRGAGLPSLRPASPQFLMEPEIRTGIELLYFGYAAMVAGADQLLAARELGRAHHRALYFIARRPGLSVGELIELLAITKQSLGRVLKDLQREGLVRLDHGIEDKRQRLLTLTAAGADLEQQLFACLNKAMQTAYHAAEKDSVTGFWKVLLGLIPDRRKPLVMALQNQP